MGTDTHLDPGGIMRISGAYWESCTLHAGVLLDIFTVVADGAETVEAAAESTAADSRSLEMLMNALVAMELLEKHGDQYANTPVSAAFLSKRSDRYMGHIIRHHAYLSGSWTLLETAVRQGKPVRPRTSFQDETVRRDFLMGMYNLAMGLAPVIVRAIDLSGRRRLLDLGGGPGTYSIHFCMNHPDLRATVLDLATTRPFAEETIRRFGLSDRIAFVPGDYVKGELPGRYDVIWMSHILHSEGPETCRSIFRKAAEILDPGGMILVHDFLLEDTMDGPLFPALFSLNMLLGTRNGQAYSEAQVREMMTAVGLRDIHRIPIDSPNDSGILAGCT